MQWVINHNIPEVTAEFRMMARAVEASRPTVLRAIGVQLLSWGFSDFRDKSTGKTAGGVTWKALTEGAIRTRLAARKPYRTLIDQGKSLAAADKPLLEELRKKLPRGKTPGRAKQRGKIARDFEVAHPQLTANRKKRLQLWRKKQVMIAKEWGGAKIGVDTGRLANSLVFGVPEIRGKVPERKNEEAGVMQNAVFEIADRSVTVGTQMSYAKGFDKLRPIFGQGFIDAERTALLQQLVQRTQAKVARRIAKHVQITGE